MAARYGLGRVANTREFSDLQRKVENLYDTYNYNSSSTNYVKCADIIDQNNSVQRKLCGSLNDIAAEGSLCCTTTKPYLRWPYYCDYPYYSYYYPYYYPYASSAAAAAAALAATDVAINATVTRKNAEIADISYKYERDLDDLEKELTHQKIDNKGLKNELENTKDELLQEKTRATSIKNACEYDINDLKSKLRAAEIKLAGLEPQAELAVELEKQIFDLKDEIRRQRTSNLILAEHNNLQAAIIRSRPVSPCFIRSRPVSPCYIRPRSVSPCRSICASPCPPLGIRGLSPLSPHHCTQVIRQESLIARYNDLFSIQRLSAMDILRVYCDNYENNQRIVFAVVQEAFNVAKKTFLDWKIRVRSTIALTHCGSETLEEAVQNYINRNIDLYDLPCMTSEVICALNRNPKISLPLGVSYSVISSFIRESCRLAWEMSTLAYPLDVAFALDGEVFDDLKYRRTYDSEYSAPLVNHHVWPCLQQGAHVIVKGEACTRRGASVIVRPSSPIRCNYRTRSPSPIRRSRSSFFH